MQDGNAETIHPETINDEADSQVAVAVTAGRSSDGESVAAHTATTDSASDSSSKPSGEPESDSGAFAPLATPIFRYFWIASIISNLGTWVHEVGAQWLMTTLNSAPEMVAAVRVAMAVPMMLTAIPAGVIADRIDRRKILIATQCVLLMTASTLATLTLTGSMTSWLLLVLTFVSGIAMVFHVLTWQSAIPELIPRSQLSRAVSLGSISFNLARSVGPALGGLLIALIGIWSAFAFNALSFAGVLFVLFRWKRTANDSRIHPDVMKSLKEGLRFVVAQRSMRNTLIRLSLFVIPAASLWSLLPLVARGQLQWQERGFGLMVTTMGVGAVLAASQLHRIHLHFGMNRTLCLSTLTYAAVLAAISFTTNGLVALGLLLVMGSCWMITLTTFNTEAQMTLNHAIRARGMSCYYATMAMSMAVGSLIWGQVGGAIRVAPAILVAAAVMGLSSVIAMLFPLEERDNATD